MWLYLGILSTVVTLLTAWYYKKVPTPTDICLSAEHAYVALREVCKVIRRNGLGVCLMWTQQVIANQIGNRLVEMHHRYYVIHYPYGVTWYKIIVPRRRGPCRIDTITDGAGNDVKKDVFSYMGPSHNFHGIKVTPEMLGYTELTFTYLNGDSRTFSAKDEILVV